MAAKPNLLLIICDQLRADALGCYSNTLVKTPNMDRLAARGVCFDRAYSQTPVCIPARHALISGKNAFELGLLENVDQHPSIPNPLAKMVRNAGYSTTAVGKMHFLPVREHFGFDRMFLSEEIPENINDDEYLQFLRKNGFGHVIEPHGKRSKTYYVPQTSELPEAFHTSAWTADTTCEVIRANKNRPFFVFSSYIKPHPPFDPCQPYDTMYNPQEVPLPDRREGELPPLDDIILVQNGYKVDGANKVTDEQLRKIRAHYYGSITQLDKQIGKLLDTLEECGLTDSTMVILTSDHGEMLGDHYSFGKRTYYEPSTRIPFIVSWPGTLPQGERRDQFVILQDIYATLVATAGGEIPSDVCGVDVRPACRNPRSPLRDQVIAEYGFNRNSKFMLRRENYKYIFMANGGREVLFDLAKDPKEFENLAAQNPGLCTLFRKELVKYYQSYGFQEALEGDSLRAYPYQAPLVGSFLDQYPHWPESLSTLDR